MKKSELTTPAAIPDRVAPTYAWRAWKLVNGTLYSLNNLAAWLPSSALEATCNGWADAHVGAIPDEACSCGIYAKQEVIDLEAYVDSLASPAIILGRVALWGKVVEHEAGFRAQYAYPIELFASSELPLVTRNALAATYGVPVRTKNRLLRQTLLSLLAFRTRQLLLPLLIGTSVIAMIAFMLLAFGRNGFLGFLLLSASGAGLFFAKAALASTFNGSPFLLTGSDDEAAVPLTLEAGLWSAVVGIAVTLFCLGLFFWFVLPTFLLTRS